MKYRCTRDAISVGGDQEFEVEADSIEEAREKFARGEGEFVADNTEISCLSPYDLDSIWQEDSPDKAAAQGEK